jgi:hypothetical protein
VRRCADLVLPVLLCVAAPVSAQPPAPLLTIDLSHELKALQLTRVLFLNDHVVLVSLSSRVRVGKNAVLPKDPDLSAKTIIVDTTQKAQLKTVALGNENARQLWPTHDSNLIVKAGNELRLYDGDLHKIAQLQLSTDYMPANVEMSPDGRVIGFQRFQRDRNGKRELITELLDTATLTPVALTNPPGVIWSLLGTGFVGEEWSGKGDLYFHPFSGGRPKLLARAHDHCQFPVKSIATDRILVGNCGSKNLQIVNLSGELVREIHDDVAFAQTSISGRTFILGFEKYSAAHFFKNFNLVANLAGVDDPADETLVRAYEADGENPIFQLKWKPKRSEPLFSAYDNSAIALSPNGKMAALIRGSSLEVYEIPTTR